MTKRSIATNAPVVSCDICGRTLLRGEHADVFLHSGSRRTVCELCTTRAMHEGWIREGVDAAVQRSGDRSGARSLLGRLRSRRAHDDPGRPVAVTQASSAAEAPDYHPASYDPDHFHAATMASNGLESHGREANGEPAPEPAHEVAPREHRQVSAVPTNAERKVACALEVFNHSSHTRTVAGVARSLGAPVVAAQPSPTEGAVVTIVVGWELSWYRYEVDLGDEAAGVRVSAQGTELSELEPEEQTPNATADEGGELHLLAAVA